MALCLAVFGLAGCSSTTEDENEMGVTPQDSMALDSVRNNALEGAEDFFNDTVLVVKDSGKADTLPQ